MFSEFTSYILCAPDMISFACVPELVGALCVFFDSYFDDVVYFLCLCFAIYSIILPYCHETILFRFLLVSPLYYSYYDTLYFVLSGM